ncbi:GNAT family N-acetyltransferase [Halomicroarcula sp. S1AR25-4]|uniref:GNAT family N-acetyltransferase n=1 Tax=Haloarcula sp. S1AR25-4 TaxID=2950538 RepID=UPI00287723B0|nr:GNAT family N-acetyltransferase [Halomicroarcula sp. S1AR25-4]MDS0277472.1 GNAT family N-acetyltransferase [Halomicroarcula sp. S1AR25-4]
MTILEPLAFETESDRRIYQFVDRHGAPALDEVRDAVDVPDDEFDERLDYLQDRGYVERQDGTVELGVDAGAEREYETPDVTYVVRPAREEDFESLVDTIRTVTDRQTYVIGENLVEELQYENTVTRHNTVWSRLFFVATVDDYIVGWSHLTLPQTEKLQGTAELTLGVRRDYRGYGIGERLLNRALDWAEAHGYWKVYNSLARTNGNAITFLERHGWEREAVRKKHYLLGEKRVDEVMLAYTF